MTLQLIFELQNSPTHKKTHSAWAFSSFSLLRPVTYDIHSSIDQTNKDLAACKALKRWKWSLLSQDALLSLKTIDKFSRFVSPGLRIPGFGADGTNDLLAASQLGEANRRSGLRIPKSIHWTKASSKKKPQQFCLPTICHRPLAENENAAPCCGCCHHSVGA